MLSRARPAPSPPATTLLALSKPDPDEILAEPRRFRDACSSGQPGAHRYRAGRGELVCKGSEHAVRARGEAAVRQLGSLHLMPSPVAGLNHHLIRPGQNVVRAEL